MVIVIFFIIDIEGHGSAYTGGVIIVAIIVVATMMIKKPFTGTGQLDPA